MEKQRNKETEKEGERLFSPVWFKTSVAPSELPPSKLTVLQFSRQSLTDGPAYVLTEEIKDRWSNEWSFGWTDRETD